MDTKNVSEGTDDEQQEGFVQEETKREKEDPLCYSYSKSGDKINLGCAAFFALAFLLPAVSVGLAGTEGFGGILVCLILGLIPLRFVFKEIYSRSVSISKTAVEYSQSGIYLKNASWVEPIANYSDIIETSDGEYKETILWHSWDDSKNVIISSEYRRDYDAINESRNKVERLLKGTAYGTERKLISLKRKEGYIDRSYFEVFNRTKDHSPSITKLLFPDNHLKLMEDESGVFMMGINKGIRVFMAGLACLGFSFLLFPWVFRVDYFTELAFVLHICGILLFNFGSTEQVLKLEKRSLTISRRWFRRRMVELEHVAFADIRSVEVQKVSTADTGGKDMYFLRIGTIGSFYEFARTTHREELEWLAETVVDRILKLDATFVKPIQ